MKCVWFLVEAYLYTGTEQGSLHWEVFTVYLHCVHTCSFEPLEGALVTNCMVATSPAQLYHNVIALGNHRADFD